MTGAVSPTITAAARDRCMKGSDSMPLISEKKVMRGILCPG